MKKQNKKLDILEIGARLIHQNGFNHTGLQEILQEANVPKGSFYFYFKNKEDFGLQVIDYIALNIESTLNSFLMDEKYKHIDRLRKFLNDFLNIYIESDFQGGCPMGNLALEMADTNEMFRNKLNDNFTLLTKAIENTLRQAQEKGEISEDKNIKELAKFITFSWEGVIMQMKINREREALDIFNHFVFEKLLK